MGALEISCHAHIHANVHADAVRPLIATISGIVNTTLSFNAAGSMGDFKACMCGQIKQRLQIRVGYAGLDADIYRMSALRMFFAPWMSARRAPCDPGHAAERAVDTP